jgi:hypothetical protein
MDLPPSLVNQKEGEGLFLFWRDQMSDETERKHIVNMERCNPVWIKSQKRLKDFGMKEE